MKTQEAIRKQQLLCILEAVALAYIPTLQLGLCSLTTMNSVHLLCGGSAREDQVRYIMEDSLTGQSSLGEE